MLERPSLTRLIFYTIVVHTVTEKRKTYAIPLACYVTELAFSPWINACRLKLVVSIGSTGVKVQQWNLLPQIPVKCHRSMNLT
jgi:hypothetical protein